MLSEAEDTRGREVPAPPGRRARGRGCLRPAGLLCGPWQPACWRVVAGSLGQALPSSPSGGRLTVGQHRAGTHARVVFCVKQELTQPQESHMFLLKIKPFGMDSDF